jgi:hypothetical protein
VRRRGHGTALWPAGDVHCRRLSVGSWSSGGLVQPYRALTTRLVTHGFGASHHPTLLVLFPLSIPLLLSTTYLPAVHSARRFWASLATRGTQFQQRGTGGDVL